MRSQGLAAVVAEHLEQTKGHAERLEHVFRAAGAEPSSILSPPVEKLAQRHDQLAANIPDDRLADVFHAAAAVTTEHHELAAYETLLALGRVLEVGDALGLLEENRREESEALRSLESELARLLGELPQ